MSGTQLVLTLAFVAVVAGLAIVLIRSRRQEPPNEPVVLGQQLADAHRVEEERLSRGPSAPSPLSDIVYQVERGDYDLMNVVPLEIDERVRLFSREYSTQDDVARATTRRLLSMDDLYTLIQFAKRSAVLALNGKDSARCADAAFALAALDEKRIDPRDASWAAGILAYSANMVGDRAGPLSTAASLATPAIAETLTNAAEREPDLAGWGYLEVEIDGRKGLVATGYSNYAPTTPLLQFAIAVLKVLRDGDYPSGGIEVASEAPSVWLEVSRQDEVEKVLARCPAIVKIRGELRESLHAEARSQMWVAWLVETSTPESARELAESVSLQPVNGRFVEGAHLDRLFCLIVAGSSMSGVSSPESAASLRSQKATILEAIDKAN